MRYVNRVPVSSPALLVSPVFVGWAMLAFA
jgi:hypothetical protein